MEEWRSVVGWEGLYEVSNLGRIRSVTREVERDFVWNRGRIKRRGKRIHEGRLLSIYRGQDRSSVRISGAGRKATLAVHRVVAAAFLGTRSEGFEIAHNNGDPHDNRVSNLRYATPKQNAADKLRHGTHLVGTAVYCAKLTEDQVRVIRALPKGTIRQHAEEIGMKPALLYQVRSRNTWRHI